MNEHKLDELMKSYTELEELIELRGFSDLDLNRLIRLKLKLENLIEYMKKEIENDEPYFGLY